jgi:hypothetical integral membrane protein (TIGR02206 family)
MRLFGALHLGLLAAILGAALLLAWLCRRGWLPARALRLTLGGGLALNELGWWVFRYSREGIHLPNLPLQLCDVAVWAAVLACLTLRPLIVEAAYFGGLAGAGMAVLTPDLLFAWPSYPAVYFFLAHGGVIVAAAVLVFGGIAPPRPGAVWRAFGMLLAYAAAIGVFNAAAGTNYMYLCRKPANASLLDALGPWPLYLFTGAAVALALFWLLSLLQHPSR